MPSNSKYVLPPEEIDGYTLLEGEIGRGSFGRVYRGHKELKDCDKGLPDKVAIKIFFDYQSDQTSVDARLQEGKLLQNLSHPNIVQVFKVDKDEKSDIPFIIMSLEKSSLRKRYPLGTPVPLNKIVRYVKQIASALDYAHTRHIIHRDVKPENILLTNEDEAYDEDSVRLSDFGISLLLLPRVLSLKNGMLRYATPEYQAPEEWKGKPPHYLSDQYSLAVMVYEWLCGELPFNGSLETLAMLHTRADPPSLREKNSQISSAIEKVVMKGLSKVPEDRYTSVSQFAEELEKAAFASAEVPAEPQRYGRREVVAALGLTVALVAAEAGILEYPNFSRWLLMQQHPLVSMYKEHQSDVKAVAWSPNGKRIASAGSDGIAFVWNMVSGRTLAPPYNHHSRVISMAWDTNGKYIYSVTADERLHIWDSTSGKLSQMYKYLPRGVSFDPVATVTWARTGDLAASRGNMALVYDAPMSNGFRLPDNLYTDHTEPVNALSFSPKSDMIASASSDSTVQIWNPENAQFISIYYGHNSEVLSVGWSPKSDLIASGGGGDDYSVQIWYALQSAQHQIGDLYDTYTHHGPVLAVTWSPKGEYLVSSGEDGIAQVWKKIDKSRSPYIGHSDSINVIAVSPDGKLVATGSDDKTVQVWQV